MATKLNPVVVKSIKAAVAQAQQDGRARPVVAINTDGKLVVCCRRTARNNAWTIQEVLNTAAAPAPAPAPAPVKAKVEKAVKPKHSITASAAVASFSDNLAKALQTA